MIRFEERKEVYMQTIHDAVCEMFDVKTIRAKGRNGAMTRGTKSKDAEKQKLPIARWIFCKYVLENGDVIKGRRIVSPNIADFIGSKDRQYATIARRKLNEKLKQRGKHWHKWQEFKTRIKQSHHDTRK